MKHLDRGTLDALAEEEIVSCAAVPVHVALTIADVAMLIETLQVALRHPEFPPLTSKAVSGWIQQVAAGVSQWTPAFHEIVMRSESPTLEASPIISSEESDS